MEFAKWKEPLGDEKCPYCYRWVLNLGLFSLRLHHWVASDDNRALHDHPYWFITFILKGRYYDVTEKKVEKMSVGTLRYRRRRHTHTVMLQPNEECWSLLLTGPKIHRWGFHLPDGRYLRSERYFRRFGKHPCQ